MRELIDVTENHYGNILVDFLVDSNFCMVNGRVGNNDNFTCVSKKGRSVVDYVLIPHENLHSVSDFKVNLISDLINVTVLVSMYLKRDQTIPYLNGNYPPSIRMYPIVWWMTTNLNLNTSIWQS